MEVSKFHFVNIEIKSHFYGREGKNCSVDFYRSEIPASKIIFKTKSVQIFRGISTVGQEEMEICGTSHSESFYFAGEFDVPSGVGKMKQPEKFDLQFFGIHRKLSEKMDPYCRLMCEQTIRAICDAGVNPGYETSLLPHLSKGTSQDNSIIN